METIPGSVGFAFLLTFLAGLSTGVGSAIAFFGKRTNKTFLSVALGFSAGVMIYVSFVEILRKAQDKLVLDYGPVKGAWITVASFLSGIILIALVDRLVPGPENPHEARAIEAMKGPSDESLHRMGRFAALAIAIHNFPEGLATFVSALTDAQLGLSIAFAIALHNIPEGISVSVPIYFATGSKKKAFWLSFFSGLSEPVGAVVGYFLLRTYFSPLVFGVLFAAVAGIMVFISIDELFPTAKEYGKGHAAVYGLVGGMATMALSLLLFMS
ncbi:MAG: zinc transporter ZupT [Syntrophobacteraceae bacterium]|jgi:ZIP family zinc transporter|nr:zinc transporter ZupT [Syntrophobacteraceae bacterium]